MMRRLIWLAILLVAGFGPTTAEAGGQELRVGAMKSWADHDLLGSPVGLSAVAGVQLGHPVGVRLGLVGSRDHFESLGSTCVGLAAPNEDCGVEVRAERAGQIFFELSLPVVVWERARVSLAGVPGVQAGWVASNQEGARTGRTREADKAMYGLVIGGEARFRPSPQWPVRLDLSASTGWHRAIKSDVLIGGYSPFEEGFSNRRLDLGLTWIR
jgi:hypothetical protein